MPKDITGIPFEDLRRSLLDERRRLLERVARTEEDLRWLGVNVEPELVEEAQEENIARLLARLDDRGIAELGAIDRALSRIGNGEYGRCTECEDSIPVDRLRALPSTATCAPCASRIEHRGT